MQLAPLIETHGYWILALGCLLEGETVLILAGFAAHQGYLNLAGVFGVAAVAGFLGDQFYFWLGRYHGAAILARWPWVARQTARVDALVHRFHAALIVGVRFAYGLRIAGPILMGTMRIGAGRFALFNALGAMLWAALIAGLGWSFGQAAELVFGKLHQVEIWLLLGLVVGSGVIWWVRRRH